MEEGNEAIQDEWNGPKIPLKNVLENSVLECVKDSNLVESTAEFVYFYDAVPQTMEERVEIMNVIHSLFCQPLQFKTYVKSEHLTYILLTPPETTFPLKVASAIICVGTPGKQNLMPPDESFLQKFHDAPEKIILPYRFSARVFSRIYLAESFSFKYRNNALIVDKTKLPHTTTYIKSKKFPHGRDWLRFAAKDKQVMLLDIPFLLYVKLANNHPMSFTLKLQGSEDFIVSDFDRVAMLNFILRDTKKFATVPRPINALTLGDGAPAPEFKICLGGYSTDLRIKQSQLLPELYHCMFAFSETPMYDRVLAMKLPFFRQRKRVGVGKQEVLFIPREKVEEFTFTNTQDNTNICILKCSDIDVIRKTIHGEPTAKLDRADIFAIFNKNNAEDIIGLARGLVAWTTLLHLKAGGDLAPTNVFSHYLYNPSGCYEWLWRLAQNSKSLLQTQQPSDECALSETTKITWKSHEINASIPQFRYYTKRFMPHLPMKQAIPVITRSTFYEWMQRVHSHIGGDIGKLTLNMPVYHEASMGIQAVHGEIMESETLPCLGVPRDAILLISLNESQSRIIVGPVYQMIDRSLLIYQEALKQKQEKEYEEFEHLSD